MRRYRRETARIRLLRTPRRGPFLPAEPSRQLPNDRGDRGDRGFREPEIARGQRRSGRRSKTLLEQRFRKSLRTLERGQGNPEPGATVANAGRNVVQELTADVCNEPFALDDQRFALLAVQASDHAEVELQESEELTGGVVKLVGDPQSFGGTNGSWIVDG